MREDIKLIEEWLNTRSAAKFLKQEKLSFNKVSKACSGVSCLQMCLSSNADYLSDFNINSRFFSYQQGLPKYSRGLGSCVVSSVDVMPFDNNCFAAVVAPRLSLFSEDIYASLREIYRVTAVEGYVYLSGVNPVSLIGFQSKFQKKKYPFSSLVGLKQMKEWLSLLGFDIVGGDFFHYSAMSETSSHHLLSSKIEKIGNRWMPLFAGGYWLVAKKRELGRTMLTSSKAKHLKPAKIVGSLASKNRN